mmetsp:Transcript_14768/g.16604  ORF Transcript_14768/g.16604 Transcript_14768/m.16604 type:complete len:791 (+) Transcript_14768:184-2556(+)
MSVFSHLLSSPTLLLFVVTAAIVLPTVSLAEKTFDIEFDKNRSNSNNGFERQANVGVGKQKNQFLHGITNPTVHSPLTWKKSSHDGKNKNEGKKNYMVLVDIWSSSLSTGQEFSLPAELEASGVFEITACDAPRGCSGFMNIQALNAIEGLSSVSTIVPFVARTANGGASRQQTTCCGDYAGARVALQIEKIIEEFPELTGEGIKIGILSDSYNLLGGAPLDVVSGDLPDDVTVLKDYPPALGGATGDEGRAMLQLVHDMAPAAKLYFRTAIIGTFDFAQGIRELADAGCDIIIDDILLFNDPMFQPNPAGIAATESVANGISYFSSIANNFGEAYIDGPYNPGPSCYTDDNGPADSCHVFPNGNTKQRINLFNDDGFCSFVMQWASPWGNATSDLDAVILDIDTGDLIQVIANDNIGGNPYEFSSLIQGSGPLDLVISLFTGDAPTHFKWWITCDTTTADPPLNDSSVSTQAILNKTAGVGAVNEFQVIGSLVKEPFSSAGGQPILYDQDGNRLPEPQINQKPNIMGPDNTLNTFFPSSGNSLDPPNFQQANRFLGTSAAAPNIGGLAALMRQAAPDLTPEDIVKLLEETATDMDTTGFDFNTGFGYVNGYLAVVTAVEAQEELDSTPEPTTAPTDAPSDAPANTPTDAPTNTPTDAPTDAPTNAPTNTPTDTPTDAPTDAPTNAPTDAPTNAPTTMMTTPTEPFTFPPTNAPTNAPTNPPTDAPTNAPTNSPTESQRMHRQRTHPQPRSLLLLRLRRTHPLMLQRTHRQQTHQQMLQPLLKFVISRQV